MAGDPPTSARVAMPFSRYTRAVSVPAWGGVGGFMATLCGVDEVRSIFGVTVEPRRCGAHAGFVLSVDEPVDRSLEPAPWRFRDVVPLFEVQPRLVGGNGLQVDAAGLVVPRFPADHRVRVPDLGFDVMDQLERGALPPERHLVDHASEAAVVMLVARPEDVAALDHRRVVGPVVIVLEEC